MAIGHEAKLIYLLAYCNWHFSMIMTIILWFRLALCDVSLSTRRTVRRFYWTSVHQEELRLNVRNGGLYPVTRSFGSPGGASAQCPQWGTIPCQEEFIFVGLAILLLWFMDFLCWFLEFMFHQLLRLALIYMSFIVAWWMKLGVWHSFLSLRRSLRYWLISYWFFNYLFITAWHCDYYTFSHISYSISFLLIFIARLIRLLFSS